MYLLNIPQVLVFFVTVICDSVSESVFLQYKDSILIGKKLHTVFENKPYVAFWEIYYGVPPVGELRFKPPKIAHDWNNNTYDYSNKNQKTCRHDFHENCLYLSIFMPICDNKSIVLPVVVWAHENLINHEPDFFIDEDIVTVIISYRTSVFGYLNTEDSFAAGNMGAKDVILALKWIKNKINNFKGDPNRVTVIGMNKAAVVVASLILSSAAEDLFSRAIIHSGSALSPSDYRNYNFDVINKLYWNLNKSYGKFNRTKFYEMLADASLSLLLSASENLFDSTEVRDNQRLINTFGPTVEVSKKNNVFMNKSPLEIYKRKHKTNNNVEVMIGYTSLESLYKLQGFAKNRKLLKYLNYNFQYLLPFEGLKDEYESKRYWMIRRKIMDFYFVNGTIGERSLRRYAKYVSDQVIYPLLRQARLHTEVSCNNVYLYRFSFRGSFNIVWNSLLPNLDWSGATSGDEICYLFKCKSVNDAYNSTGVSNERHFIKKIARLLANFAKCGNPTPIKNDSILGDLQWNPLHRDSALKGMNLGRKIKMVDIPEQTRMNFWDELKTVFFPNEVTKAEL